MSRNIGQSSATCSCKLNSPCFIHFMNPAAVKPVRKAARRKVEQPNVVILDNRKLTPATPMTIEEDDDMETIAEYYKMPALLSPISSPRRKSVDSGVCSNSEPELPHPVTLKRPRTPGKDTNLPKRAKKDVVPKIPDDYLREFTKIISYEQRQVYKKAHRLDFQEYTNLYEIVSERSLIFDALEEKLKRERVGSRNYANIVKVIFEEYGKSQEMYTRFHYLEAKLSHIKLLVKNYDKSHNTAMQKKLLKLYGRN